MTKSIVQVSGVKECCLCKMEALAQDISADLPQSALHRHHIIYGRGRRSLSEKYGLWVWLCPDHHEFGPAAVHHSGTKEGKENDRLLKIIAQKSFEQIYGHDKWMEVFGENYIY